MTSTIASQNTYKKGQPLSKEEINALIQSAQLQTDSNIRYGETGDQARDITHKKEYIGILEGYSIPWCLAAEPALLFYGVPLISPPIHTICVPDRYVETARDALLSSGKYKMTRFPDPCIEEIYATCPLLKRKGVHLNIRLIPSSLYDINHDTDCIAFNYKAEDLILRALRPESLMHAFLHLFISRKHLGSLTNAEYLLLHNPDDPNWGDSMVDLIKDDDKKDIFKRMCKSRDRQRAQQGGIYRGKWDDTTMIERLANRVNF